LGHADRNYPEVGPSEEKVLSRFLELYQSRGDVLDRLIRDAGKKFKFSEEAVRFWAPRLVEGRFGPLDPLLSEDLEEIMVKGVGEPVFVYDRSEGTEETNLSVTSSEYFLELANRMLAPLGRRVNSSNPRETGVLDSGDRISVAVPPYSRDFVLSIRKYSVEPFTIPDLIGKGMLTCEAAAFLWMVMEVGNINLGVVGNTGSGKTTLLNALTRFIPKNNRLIMVEDIPEIKPLQKQTVGLLSNRSLGLSMRDAILDSLRLRPDRVIIGEVRRDSEVEALRESCLAGHAMGTYFTYHAESSKWAYRRLVHQGFPEYDLPSISLVVVCRRHEKSGKILREVTEISGKTPVFRLKGASLKKVGKFSSEYLDLAFNNLDVELKRRAAFLKGCGGLGDVSFFEKIQEWSRDI
jgi:type IV secretory pathway ATPase VirB11/archaellum biosynthesis ATPase